MDCRRLYDPAGRIEICGPRPAAGRLRSRGEAERRSHLTVHQGVPLNGIILCLFNRLWAVAPAHPLLSSKVSSRPFGGYECLSAVLGLLIGKARFSSSQKLHGECSGAAIRTGTSCWPLASLIPSATAARAKSPWNLSSDQAGAPRGRGGAKDRTAAGAAQEKRRGGGRHAPNNREPPRWRRGGSAEIFVRSEQLLHQYPNRPSRRKPPPSCHLVCGTPH